MKPVDFDKLFAGHFRAWFEAHRGAATEEEMEAALPKVYGEWLNRPLPALGGVAPANYFAGRPAAELLALLRDYLDEKVPVSDVLLETIVECKDAGAVLSELKRGGSAELRLMLMNMLAELEDDACWDCFADLLLNASEDAEVRELAVELLAAGRGAAREGERLLDAAERADEATRTMIADVVVNLAGNERAYRLLTDLFCTADDVALTASYLAKFGDDRVLPLLREAILREDINYAEFVELRNAVEALGGEVERSPRSFENDPYYRALKGLKE